MADQATEQTTCGPLALAIELRGYGWTFAVDGSRGGLRITTNSDAEVLWLGNEESQRLARWLSHAFLEDEQPGY